jgi:curved DNA-binding protein CbpA
MFVDYYAILEVSFDATQESIRSAFYKQALKWHPDKNPGIDTTYRMQQINEAYLMLKDPEARQRYNKEYQRFNEFQQQSQYHQKQQKQQEWGRDARGTKFQQEQEQGYAETFTDSTYEIFDDTLNNWMSNARKQAVDLAKQTLEDLIGMSKAGGAAMGNAAIKGVVRYLVFGFVMLIIFKTCGR